MPNLDLIRKRFPILQQEINGHPLVYLDNAATTQKPQKVIAALTQYYEGTNANVHRGAHTLAAQATMAFEETRKSVQEFIGASLTEEIIFTKGTTEGINLLAQSWGTKNLRKGDEILISVMEHHANIVPWQLLCEKTGASLKVIPMDEKGVLDFESFAKMLNAKTKLLAMVHVSNTLGTINEVEKYIAQAHQNNTLVFIDGAQAVPHLPIDVQKMDCDFYAFSAHKLYGPTGLGVFYGKKKWLEDMPPYMGGGEMIKEVRFTKTTYNCLPYKFEAGTPNIADAIAFKYALDFLAEIGRENILVHENNLLRYATDRLQQIEGLQIVGQAPEKAALISFLLKGIHAYDLGMMLDAAGVAIRTGHHCTQPLMRRLGIEGTARASFALYNTKAEIDALANAIEKAVKTLK